MLINKIANCLKKADEDLTRRSLPNYPKRVIDFSSNDYLGFSKDPRILEAGIIAAKEYGVGSTGSRLLSGNFGLCEEFENQIALDKNTEAALIFNSGFQANSGVLECLSDKDTVVIFDKLNHASMYQGVFASGAKLIRYEHLDYSHLEDILKSNTNKKILLVSETVFGMDGDIADLDALIQLSEKYGALLYLDEAHATGLYGPKGYGISTNYTFNKDRTVIMGTFSKAIGANGAYIACSNLIKDFLIQKCKSFIYSTALSPFLIGAAKKSWELIPSLGEVRKDIFEKSNKLRKRLNGKGKETNIVPIVFSSIEDMLNRKKILQNLNIIVSGIRPPTSPTPRLRIAVSATHSDSDIDKLVEGFAYGV